MVWEKALEVWVTVGVVRSPRSLPISRAPKCCVSTSSARVHHHKLGV